MKAKIINLALYAALAAAFCWFVVWNGVKDIIPMAVVFVLVAVIVYRHESR